MLDKLMAELKTEVSLCDVIGRNVHTRDLFSGRTLLTDEPFGVHESALKILLLRISTIIYVHEQRDFQVFNVLRGGQLVEASRALVQNKRSAREWFREGCYYAHYTQVNGHYARWGYDPTTDELILKG
jgi:hypothetical protein